MEKMTPAQAKEELQQQVRGMMMAAGLTGKQEHIELFIRYKAAVDLAAEALDLMDKQLEIEKKED